MKKKKDSGEVVVEASIVVTIALIFLTVMLFIGIVLYHQTMLTSVANKTAASVAQLYSNSAKDPFTGYIDDDSIYQAITYSDFKTNEYIEEIEAKANALAKYRLLSSSMLKAEIVDVDVKLVAKPEEVLKSQLIVTLKGRYNVPLVGIFKVGDGTTEFSVTGRADCFDILEYVNGVEALGNPEGENAVPVIKDTCVVTFILNKHDGDFYAAVPVLKGESIISSNHYSHSSMPKNPIFNDIEFTGWVTANGAPFTSITTVSSDMTVYGSWLCMVNFEPAGGNVSPNSLSVPYHQTISFPTPSRSGYAFEGWYTEPEGRGTRYYSGVTEITSNITLYAKWRCTHDFNATEIRKGTCIQKYRYKYTCVRCPYTYEADGDLGTHKQGSGQVTVKPSCTSTGKKIYKCEYCKAILVNQMLDKLPHNRDIKENPVAPTCTVRGYTNYRCSMCRRITHTDYANALGHSMQSYEKAATCTESGYRGSKCTRCGLKNGSEIAALGHDFDARCGKIHNLGGQAYFMPKHNRSAGYKITTSGECILCIRCAAPRDGWVLRGGQWVSGGMICRYHTDNLGSGIYCGSWMSMKNLGIH